ncbi:MAG TPA: response regulator, partial [Opitutaceae bacterium]|nr:response regulator [Opitutaceae bacterium]
VLLDLYLPDASGTQGFTRLARAAPQVPIIVLTGSEDATIERQLIVLGARDYLRKGHFNGKLLASVLVNWISLARASA